jgi:hypothetical protein
MTIGWRESSLSGTMPQCQKVVKRNCIEGIVYMSAALWFRSHGQPHSHLNGWLFTYQVLTPGRAIADAASIRLDRSCRLTE